jgi:ribosome-associated toxin RatA of RatAB toxin-antitoxin module
MRRVSHSETIAASPQACFDALLEFETYSDWQSGVRSCRVLERDAAGRGSLIETSIDAKLRTVRYVLRYNYDEPRRIWWDYVEGDVKSIEGAYTLDVLDGGTRATYEVGVDVGFFVPGPIRKLLGETMLRRSVRELKERVEAAGG